MTEEHVSIRVGRTHLNGDLIVAERARGLVLFAHGTGSSKRSPRNRFVAEELRRAGFGTLLMNLLSVEEEQIDFVCAKLKFDIELLAERLVAAVDWIRKRPDLGDLDVAYFGASTGAGAALVAAAHIPTEIAAVVSRSGRPDMAGGALNEVKSPTLLIVGGFDSVVVELNRRALRHLNCEVDFEIVRGASHLFDEAGALERVSRLTVSFLRRHMHVTPTAQTI
jgi:putative phosphoribosyl transferase